MGLYSFFKTKIEQHRDSKYSPSYVLNQDPNTVVYETSAELRNYDKPRFIEHHNYDNEVPTHKPTRTKDMPLAFRAELHSIIGDACYENHLRGEELEAESEREREKNMRSQRFFENREQPIREEHETEELTGGLNSFVGL